MSRLFRSRYKILGVVAVILASSVTYHLAAMGARQGAGLGRADVVITARPVPLHEKDPSLMQVGKLTYLAGWELKAGDERFGGWSGLVVEHDGHNLTAINDQGDWLTADLATAGDTPLIGAVIQPFETMSDDAQKADYDSESLVRAPDGRFLVSFERNNRLHYAMPGGANVRSAYSDLIDFKGVEKNGGLEAITWAPDGRLLAFIEKGDFKDGNLPAWLVGDTAERLAITPPEGFAITDAATLVNGDVLLLCRSFSPMNGVAAKLLRIKAGDIKPGAVLMGEELATLAPPFTVDNMEGLAVKECSGEAPVIYMLSDDNFNFAQRTLLMMFRLDD